MVIGSAGQIERLNTLLVRDVIPTAGDHAGAWETSLMMAMRPELVDLSRLPEDPEERLIGIGGRDPLVVGRDDAGERAEGAVVELK